MIILFTVNVMKATIIRPKRGTFLVISCGDNTILVHLHLI